MKRTTRLIALIVALLLALPMAAFAEGSPVVYRELYASEVDTLNYLYTTTTNNLTIPANVVDTLIEYDRYGVLQPSLAESWEHNEDYTEWTFHIREGVKWIDSTGAEVADVTAHDWVAAAHYILDAHNDSGNEYNWEVAKVVNAAEYYAYTAYQLALESATDGTDENGNAVKLDEDGEVIEEVAAVAAEDIGVKAVDDYTLGLHPRSALLLLPLHALLVGLHARERRFPRRVRRQLWHQRRDPALLRPLLPFHL